MADEGVGPTCLALLGECFDFPEQVELLDVGTTGLAMLSYLKGFDHLIILDAAQETGHPAGTVILFTPEDLVTNQVMHSAHDMRLMDVLQAAIMTGIEMKSTIVVGVQIASLQEWVLELTPAVKAAVPIACAAVLDQLRNLGIEATPKPGVTIDPVLMDALQNYAPEGSDRN
jgi:hydrogenase maturation protease